MWRCPTKLDCFVLTCPYYSLMRVQGVCGSIMLKLEGCDLACTQDCTHEFLRSIHNHKPSVECPLLQDVSRKLKYQSVQFSRSIVSNSLRPHESQHARPPCLSPTPGVHSTHVHRASDAIQPSHPLSSPSPPAPNPSQHQSLFQ